MRWQNKLSSSPLDDELKNLFIDMTAICETIQEKAFEWVATYVKDDNDDKSIVQNLYKTLLESARVAYVKVCSPQSTWV